MVIAETLGADRNSTIVILSPASVVSKWIHEMRTKFGIWAYRGRMQDLHGKRKLPSGVSVISHGSMPSADSLELPDDSIGLLVIDEVHRFIGRTNSQNRRGRAMSLSEASKGAIGLSATPIQLEVQDLQRILDLIAPGQHPASTFLNDVVVQMALNRVIAAQSESKAPDSRDLSKIGPHLGPSAPFEPRDLEEPMDRPEWGLAHIFLQSIGPIGKRMTRARASDPDVDQAKERIVIDHYVEPGVNADLLSDIDACLAGRHSNRQQVSSCPSASVAIISHILGSDSPDDGSDWDDNYVAPPPKTGLQGDLSELKRRAELQMPNIGPKMRELLSLLRELEERPEISKVVVFTHWIPTLRHASRVARSMVDFPVHSINPNDDQDQADSKIERFRQEDGFAVLFASDRMSVGIDLEMANAAINMDLPYNPAVLQQRIGRLDRIIQESDFIEIHNLILLGSVEERIRHVIEARTEVFKGVIGGMENIVEPDHKDFQTDDDAKRVLAGIRREADVDMLAQSDVLLRVLDSSLDGLIGERRRALHPIHARRYLIIAKAMERLGGESSWDEQTGILDIKLNESTRRALLASKAFFPWGADHVFATFESVDDEGWISIPTRGRSAVIGPLHPFLEACSSILLSIEGMEPSDSKPNGEGLIGISREQPRWKTGKGGVLSAVELDALVQDAIDHDGGRVWNLSGSDTRGAFRGE
jgi:superfamily II DNA or RNA helicase